MAKTYNSTIDPYTGQPASTSVADKQATNGNMFDGILEELGIYSPAQKRVMAANQEMQRRAMEQQNRLVQAQYASHMANMGQSYGFPSALASGALDNPSAPASQLGSMLGGGLKKLGGIITGNRSGPTQGIQSQPDSQDSDSTSDLITNAIQSSNGDIGQALVKAGRALLNSSNLDQRQMGVKMLAKGTQLTQEMDAKKAQTERDQTQATQNEASANKLNIDAGMATTGAKIGDTRTIQDGENQHQEEVVDIKNGKPIWAPIGSSGPRSPKQTIQNFDDPRTGSQKGEDFSKFKAKTTSTLETLDLLEKVKEGVKNGAANGWVGSAAVGLDNALQGTRQVISMLKDNGKFDASAQKYLDNPDLLLNTEGWNKLVTTTAIGQARLADLTFALAAAQNPDGRLSEKDIVRAAKQVGANIVDPKKAVAMFDSVAKDVLDKYDISYKTLQAASPDIGEQAKGLYGLVSEKRKSKQSNQENDPEYQEYIRLKQKHGR